MKYFILGSRLRSSHFAIPSCSPLSSWSQIVVNVPAIVNAFQARGRWEKIILRASPKSCLNTYAFGAGLAPWACNQYSYTRPVGSGLVPVATILTFLINSCLNLCFVRSSNGTMENVHFLPLLIPRTISPQLAPLPSTLGHLSFPHHLFHSAAISPLCTVAVACAPMEDWCQVKCPKTTLGQGLATAAPTLRCQCQSTKQDSLGT